MKEHETEFLMKIFEATQELEKQEKAKALKPKARVTQVMCKGDSYEVFIQRLKAILESKNNE